VGSCFSPSLESYRGQRVVDSLRGRSLAGIAELTRDEAAALLDYSISLKAGKVRAPSLQHKTMAMLFEKPSLRTRVTFETAMTQLGGHAIYLQPADISLGERETVADAARCLGRWVDCIMARTFAHKTVTDLAEYSRVPVINGLSDLEHPCQAFADLQTISERKGELRGLKLAYVGDGNNVANSLALLCAKLGVDFSCVCPPGYEPNAALLQLAKADADQMGCSVEIEHGPDKGVFGADVLYTDVWASMGFESERAERAKVFASYQLNSRLVSKARPDAIVLHCLPAHRGEEITDDVIDGPQSAVFDQAENRLHTEKAILCALIGG
jgi:ornithine carbamoyltransferase